MGLRIIFGRSSIVSMKTQELTEAIDNFKFVAKTMLPSKLQVAYIAFLVAVLIVANGAR